MAKGGYQEELEGSVRAGEHRWAVVVARFNGHVTGMLLESARACFVEHGAAEDDVEVIRVPGAWELPQAARLAGRSGRFAAVVALGCVIRGETPHFDFISAEAARGLGAAARETGVPVVFGVLTTDTEAQALERADPERGAKGREAALSAMEMVRVYRDLTEPSS